MMIKGQKVILRPLKLSDAPRFVKWFNNSLAHKFLRVRKMTLPAERKWIRQRLKEQKNFKTFAIDTIKDEHIGSISLDLNLNDNNAEFGIMIGERKFWNKGLGTEAAKLIIDFGFKKLELHRIYLVVAAFNPRAIKVYRRLGFRMEGTKREHVKWQGKYFDSYLMGILDKEWKK